MSDSDSSGPPPLEEEPPCCPPQQQHVAPVIRSEVYVSGRGYIPSTKQTGPKGVLNDAKQAGAHVSHSVTSVRPQSLSTRPSVAVSRDPPSTRGPHDNKLAILSRDQYVSFIDDSPHAYVIMHLADPDSPLCHALDTTLAELAEDYPQVAFGAINAREAKPDYDLIACPTLIIYRNGHVEETYVRVTDNVGDECDYHAVERLLTKQGVLQRLM